MKKPNTWLNLLFLVSFAVLTFCVWLPIYGQYGETLRIFGLPSWVIFALAAGGVLFVMEWIYLFNTNLAVNDEDVEEIIEKLIKEDI